MLLSTDLDAFLIILVRNPIYEVSLRDSISKIKWSFWVWIVTNSK